VYFIINENRESHQDKTRGNDNGAIASEAGNEASNNGASASEVGNGASDNGASEVVDGASASQSQVGTGESILSSPDISEPL